MSELDQYDYDLPRELIAQHPLASRSDARLMVVRRDDASISHAYVRDLPEMLPRGDCLVFNDTKVIPARLVGRRQRTGARWSGLFLAADEHGVWQVLSKTRGKLEPGETIEVVSWDTRHTLKLQLVAKLDGGAWAVIPEGDGESDGEALALLAQVGRVPLPPYIRDGDMVEDDTVRYQTVFAKNRGAVAAPTAGLHFTPELLGRLDVARVTLHVGLDTFRPIETDTLEAHEIHTERYSVAAAEWERIQTAERVVAVGTTTVRVLETLASNNLLQGRTGLFITPGYEFKRVDALLTNFHLPRSTLLALVMAFAGVEETRRLYELAIAERYRFYSFGDAMLVL